MEVYRQGDVSIIAVSNAAKPKGTKLAEPILARGEVTGHAHRIVEGKIRLYQLATGLLYLRVLSEFAKLYHEEHEDIVLPQGTMKFDGSVSSIGSGPRGCTMLGTNRRRHWTEGRKDDLTEAQWATLPAICEKWRNIVISTAPYNQKTIEKQLDCYANWKDQRPEFIWLRSPFELSEALLSTQRGGRVNMNRGRSVDDAVQRFALRYYKARPIRRAETLIADSVPSLPSPFDLLRASPDGPKNPKGGPAYWLWRGTQSHELGQHIARSAALAKLFWTAPQQFLFPLYEIPKHCGCVWLYRESLICIERPRLLSFDERGRLHCLDGPAIEYRDGSAVYAIHGVQIPKKWVDIQQNQLDFKEIVAEPNSEVRRALIAKYGFVRLLETVPSKVISRSKGNALLELKMPSSKWHGHGTEYVRVLHLKWHDKTGPKETILPVPRHWTDFGNDRPLNRNSCEQVRRWTLGWSKEAIAVAET